MAAFEGPSFDAENPRLEEGAMSMACSALFPAGAMPFGAAMDRPRRLTDDPGRRNNCGFRQK